MSDGFIYLMRRDKSAIKILSRAKVSEKTSNPNPYSMVEDPILANGVAETIKENVMEWKAYAEPGTVEQIMHRLKSSGVKLPVGKHHPVVKKEYGTVPVSHKHTMGKLPTGRKS